MKARWAGSRHLQEEVLQTSYGVVFQYFWSVLGNVFISTFQATRNEMQGGTSFCGIPCLIGLKDYFGGGGPKQSAL
jgi:hypothetical protein